MSTPRSWAKIEFPANFLDADIKKKLADYYGESENGEPDIEAGIFSLEDGEAAYGEFEDLEALLIEKDIPFDRHSGMDWNRKPVRQVFRPPCRDLEIDLNDDGDEVVSVKAIREVASMGITGAVTNFLNEHFPTYPPLADFVKEV